MIKYTYLFIILTFSYFKASAGQVSCNFDSNWCNFVPNSFFERYTGDSPSFTSGPDEDRTGDGYYALCNGKLLTNPSDKCVLYVNISLSKETDFEFWYYMNGLQIGTLEVILNENDIAWSLTGRQKNEWLSANIKLPAGNYKLEFSANRSISGRTSADIAIDDVFLQGQPLTTQLVTITRTTAIPLLNISSNFDSQNNFNGWHTNFERNKWIQTDGTINLVLGLPGPESDWSSVTTQLKNTSTLRPINSSCSIPYSIYYEPEKLEYYCKKIVVFWKNYFVCGLIDSPIANNRDLGICSMGNYMMITSDKFENEIGSFRSRFYSPVFKLDYGTDLFCLSFKYNIFTSSNDGFKVYIENYENENEFEIIYFRRGPLRENRWYSIEIPVYNVTYDQIIIFFEPIRGRRRDSYASISIDSVILDYRDCELTTEEIITEYITELSTNQETTENTETSTHEYTESTTIFETSDVTEITTIFQQTTSEDQNQITTISEIQTVPTNTTVLTKSTTETSTVTQTTTELTISFETEKAANKNLNIYLGVFIPVGIILVLSLSLISKKIRQILFKYIKFNKNKITPSNENETELNDTVLKDTVLNETTIN